MAPLPCLARSSVFSPFRGLSGVGQREGAFGNLLFPLQGRLYLRLLLLTQVPNSVLYLQIPVSSLYEFADASLCFSFFLNATSFLE
jgi:hypothetical protein